MLSFSSASEQSSPPPCHPTTTFAGDISAPKLTFRFGAAATATAAAAATASSFAAASSAAAASAFAAAATAPASRASRSPRASSRSQPAPMPVTTQAFLDGGTGALKSTLRFPFAAEGATAPLSRGGGTAARSRATCRRANHLLAAASTAAAATSAAAAAAVAAACLWKTSRRAALRCLRLLSCAGMADDAPSPPPGSRSGCPLLPTALLRSFRVPEEDDHAVHLHSAVTCSSSLAGNAGELPQLPASQAPGLPGAGWEHPSMQQRESPIEAAEVKK